MKNSQLFGRVKSFGFSLAFVLVLFGCKTRPLGPYVLPQVVGQVFAADTRRPLAGVKVTRGSVERRASPPRGAEALMAKVPVQTSEDGRFKLASERVLSIVRGAGWDVVPINFERMGYLSFHTNCLTSSLTNNPAGEPVLDLGPIFIQSAAK